MNPRIFCIACATVALVSAPACAQPLKEKAGFGGNLSAIEATAILAAEIKYCEINSPDFKAQAGPLWERMRADVRYKEMERNPEFTRLAPEAYALVKERNQGAVVATVCRNTLERLKQPAEWLARWPTELECPLNTSPITRRFLAGWADMDWNSHMANTAYLNKVVDARVLALAEKGFPMDEFIRLRLGVVIMKDEVEYRREVKWMEEIDITFSLAGIAPDGSRFKVQNEVRRTHGDLAARITSTGGFMDLDARKLVVPPPSILAAYLSLPRTEDFIELPSSMKARA